MTRLEELKNRKFEIMMIDHWTNADREAYQKITAEIAKLEKTEKEKIECSLTNKEILDRMDTIYDRLNYLDRVYTTAEERKEQYKLENEITFLRKVMNNRNTGFIY